MWTAKWILDTYEGGDGTARSDMYMIYRDLRGYFDEIEARPENRSGPGATPEAGKTAGSWLSQHLRLVRG